VQYTTYKVRVCVENKAIPQTDETGHKMMPCKVLQQKHGDNGKK
jgi:hypothetical protein